MAHTKLSGVYTSDQVMSFYATSIPILLQLLLRILIDLLLKSTFINMRKDYTLFVCQEVYGTNLKGYLDKSKYCAPPLSFKNHTRQTNKYLSRLIFTYTSIFKRYL